MKKTKVAFFDIDGTIFRKNLHFELINELVWLKVFPQKVRKILVELYSNWIEHEGVYDDYRKQLVILYAEYIAGCSPSDVKKASQILMPFHEKRTYIFAEQLMKKFREEGYYIVAISGSPSEIVDEYNRRYLRFDEALGSVYSLDSKGLYTGEADFEPTKNKGFAARQIIAERHLTLEDSYALGDTESDASLLQIVEHPIAFNPNQNLKVIAEAKGWRVVVEKKDVIYEIK
jgi:HAD superfamily hydrolase (TIGR01490 family)